MSNPTSFSSIILGSGLVTVSGNNLYINGLLPNIGVVTNNNNIVAADFDNYSLKYGDITFLNWANGTISNGTYNIIDWGNGVMKDINNFTALEWIYNRYLVDSSGVTSLDYNYRTLDSGWKSMPPLTSGEIVNKYYVDSGATNLVRPTGNQLVLDYTNSSGLQFACKSGVTPYNPSQNNTFTVRLHEITNNLQFFVKYSNGIVKSGSISLS